MTQPHVTTTELDGALGILPPSSGRLLAIVGPSTSGTPNVPASFARIKDVQTAFGAGPLVEAAAHYIERYGKPVLLVKTATTTAAVVSAVDDHSAVGTSDVTVHTGAAPVDNLELILKITKDGTVGTAGITYMTSDDGGRTWSAESALGTANTVVFPGAGVTFDLAAGTLKKNEYYTALATPATWNTTDMGTALDALKTTLQLWELALIVGDIDANAFDTIELKFAGMQTGGKYHAWIGNVRIPTVGETAAAYMTALSSLSSAKSTILGALGAGGCKLTSSVSGKKYRRPAAWPVAARAAANKAHINGAELSLGALAGVSIRDDNGNPDEYDESVNPGLDDMRFFTLRTWDGYPGVYVNRERMFAPPTSDFQLLTYRRVMNIGLDALRVYFANRLSKRIIVSKTTGRIVASDAIEIELGALNALRAALMAEPMASDVQFTLSRFDNLLSTKKLTGDARIVPLAYPEEVALTVGFINPAMLLQAA